MSKFKGGKLLVPRAHVLGLALEKQEAGVEPEGYEVRRPAGSESLSLEGKGFSVKRCNLSGFGNGQIERGPGAEEGEAKRGSWGTGP